MGVLEGSVLENRFCVNATCLRQTFKYSSAELGDRSVGSVGSWVGNECERLISYDVRSKGDVEKVNHGSAAIFSIKEKKKQSKNDLLSDTLLTSVVQPTQLRCRILFPAGS